LSAHIRSQWATGTSTHIRSHCLFLNFTASDSSSDERRFLNSVLAEQTAYDMWASRNYSLSSSSLILARSFYCPQTSLGYF